MLVNLVRWLSAWCLAFAVPLVAAGDDWPEWRGPRRDGVSRETDCLAAWPASSAPQVLWRAAVGRGHAAMSISDGRAYTAGWDGERDTIYCFDAATGQLVWKQSYPSETIAQWPGPRATPTVSGGRVFTLGQHGQLRCWDAARGTPIWQRQLVESYKPDADYGFAWSPLVEEDLLILGGGRRGLALRTSDGKPAWGDDGAAGACASAVRYTASGRSGVALVVNNQRESVAVVGVDPRTGEEQWRSPDWPEKWGAACVDPLVVGDSIFLTTAEQHARCVRYTMRDGQLDEDWSSGELACYTGGCVLVEGQIYGVTKAGVLKCLDWETGEERWAKRGFDGHGALIAADGMLFVQASESGELIVVRAQAEAYEEPRRHQVFGDEPVSFTAPVLANGRLYCRSYAGEVVCLQVGAARE